MSQLIVTNEPAGGHAIKVEWDGKEVTLVYVRPVGTIEVELTGPLSSAWVPDLASAVLIAGAVANRPQSHAPVTQVEADRWGIRIGHASPLG